MTKELLLSITKNDFTFTCTRGSGPGGQKRNKTSSAVHCKHEASGAVSHDDTTRSQHENKVLAFRKCVNTKEFQTWLKLETAKRTGTLKQIEEKIEREIKNNIKVEVKDEQGRWVDEGC